MFIIPFPLIDEYSTSLMRDRMSQATVRVISRVGSDDQAFLRAISPRGSRSVTSIFFDPVRRNQTLYLYHDFKIRGEAFREATYFVAKAILQCVKILLKEKR